MSGYAKFESNWTIVPTVKALYETVYGVKTHYVCAGEGEPLIMVHGGGPGASGAVGWAHTIPELAKHYRVYALDLIGAGDTDKPMVDYSLPMLADHVGGFIDALKLGNNLRIMGNSQGAYVAMKYVVDNPGRVKAAAIISTGTLSTACGLHNRGPNVPTLPRYDGTKESLRAFMALIVNDPAKLTDELIDTRYETARKHGHLEHLDSLNAYREIVKKNPSLYQHYNMRERMQALTVPTTVLWGENDRTAPLDPLGMDFKALVPQMKFHVVKGSGHQVQNDKTEECNSLLIDHFTSVK